MHDKLAILLKQLRDGPPDGILLEQARALVRTDERIPEEMHGILFADAAEAAADAEALLGVLGLEEDDRLGRLLGEAIREEIAESAALDVEHELALLAPAWEPVAVELRAALRAGAGRVEVARAVLERVGLSSPDLPLAAALREVAGTVDVADAVMARIGLAPKRVEIPAPANDPRPAVWLRRAAPFAGLALAAALLLTFLRGPAAPDAIDIHPMQFARAGEVVIEDLTVGEGVQVMELEGADGSMILWVDEEA